MTYAALTNWKFDKNVYHNIQSGPARPGNDTGLKQQYIILASGYDWRPGVQQTQEQLFDIGPDFGIITPGPPQQDYEGEGRWLNTDQWRAVPAMMSGFWTDYTVAMIPPGSSGVLTVVNGYRRSAMLKTANSFVQTAYGPEYGSRSIGTFYGGRSPFQQNYQPWKSNVSEQLPGAVDLPTTKYPTIAYEGPVTNPTPGIQDWTYAPPVHCMIFQSMERSGIPGLMSTVVPGMYRGRASRYVYNYGSAYGQGAESAVRGMIRTFSTTVNSSNQNVNV